MNVSRKLTYWKKRRQERREGEMEGEREREREKVRKKKFVENHSVKDSIF